MGESEKKKLLYATIVALIILYSLFFYDYNTDALTCACDDCQNAYQCEVDDGGVCYSKVTLLNGKVSRQKHCYTAEFVSDHYDYLCGLQSSTVAVECCSNEDYCNLELSPELLQEDEGNEATPSTDSMQPDTTDGNELNPNEPHGEDQGDNNGESELLR